MAIVNNPVPTNRIGFGTWQMGGETQFGNRQTGWGPVDESESIAAIHYALDSGIRFFDTADAYGKGRSEVLLGKAIRQKPLSDIQICTKIGSRWDGDGSFYQDFSSAWLEQAITNCLGRLQVERIDTLLLHSPPVDFDWNSFDCTFFEKLVDKGVIRKYGVSVKSHKAIQAIHKAGIGNVIEAIFNILDNRLYPISQENQEYEYIARVPLSSGFITEKTFTTTPVFNKTDIRQYIPPTDVAWLVENVRKLQFLRELPGGIEVSALRYGLSFPTISFVIPGMYKVSHVESALMANELGPLPASVIKEIEETITSLPESWK